MNTPQTQTPASLGAVPCSTVDREQGYCRKCGEDFEIEEGLEASDYCNTCAQDEVVRLREVLQELLDQHRIRVNLNDDCEMPGWAVRAVEDALKPSNSDSTTKEG